MAHPRHTRRATLGTPNPPNPLDRARHHLSTASDGFDSRLARACRHDRRLITRWATLMRHFLPTLELSPAITRLPRRMAVPPPPTRLVASSGLPLLDQTRLARTLLRAVPLATVTPRAQVHHLLAQATEVPPHIRTWIHAAPADWTPNPDPEILHLPDGESPWPRAGDGDSSKKCSRLPRFLLPHILAPQPIQPVALPRDEDAA